MSCDKPTAANNARWRRALDSASGLEPVDQARRRDEANGDRCDTLTTHFGYLSITLLNANFKTRC